MNPASIIIAVILMLISYSIIPVISDLKLLYVIFNGNPVWIPALITVVGSYMLYQKKQNEKAERLRISILAELEQLSLIDELPARLNDLDEPPTKEKIPPDTVPPADAFPTIVYESNVSDLSRLDDEVVEQLVEFYSELLRHKATIRAIHQEGDVDSIPMSDHKDLYDEVGDLKATRRKLISRLRDIE